MSQQLQMKKTERKISDISSEEASNVISLLKCMVADLDPQEEGDDVVTTSANKIIEKPSEQKVCSCIKLLAVFSCVFFYQALASSDPTTLSLKNLNAKIALKGFGWTADGEEAARNAGQASIPGAPTVDDTKKQLGNIFKVVAMEVRSACFHVATGSDPSYRRKLGVGWSLIACFYTRV